MPTDDLLLITAGSVVVEVDPVAGGRISRLRVGGTDLLVDHDDVSDPMRWGSYPMAPWAGRIRNGRFDFDGVSYQLPRNDPPHAIHGVGFTSAWTVEQHAARQIRLRLDLPEDETWPFGGRIRQTIAVDPDGVTLALSATSDERAFPVSLGWHPWFRKPSWFEFRPVAMYRRDEDHIALDELVDVPAGPWDDCFVNHAPVRLRIDDVSVELSSPCTHWVVYSVPEHATCVEPQTAPPDVFNHRPPVARPGAGIHTWCRLGLSPSSSESTL